MPNDIIKSDTEIRNVKEEVKRYAESIYFNIRAGELLNERPDEKKKPLWTNFNMIWSLLKLHL